MLVGGRSLKRSFSFTLRMTRTVAFSIHRVVCQSLLLLALLAQSEVLSLLTPCSIRRLSPSLSQRSTFDRFPTVPSAMRITELKTLLKSYGGQPGNLPHASVLSDILKYAEKDGSRFVEPDTSATASNIDNNAPEEPSSIKEFAPKYELPPMPAAPRSTAVPYVIPEPLTRAPHKRVASAQRMPQIDLKSVQSILKGQSMEGMAEISQAEVEKRIAERELPYTGGSDMELTFLGTASCTPGLTRGVSCVAMRYDKDLMLFDCGEGTQIQITRASLKVSRIRRIFVTHLHGDHAFGLAGVLCLMGQAAQNQKEAEGASYDTSTHEPVEIYGPEGIRDMVRAVIQLSYSHVVPPHRIHELKGLSSMPGGASPLGKVVHTSPTRRFQELQGTDFYPSPSGQYTLHSDDDITVSAASMAHSIPCVGFVVTEKDKPGSLRMDRFADCIARNRAGLDAHYQGVKGGHINIYRELKGLKADEVFTFPDGTSVTGKEVCDPPMPGRKVVFMGDTSNGDKIAPLAQNADVLIHEATNAFFPGTTRFTTYHQVEWNTKKNGHSTPEMAGKFAHKIGAKKMFLSHFSARYLGDTEPENVYTMMQIEKMAQNEYLHSLLGTQGRCGGKAGSGTNGGSSGGTSGRGGSSGGGGSGDEVLPIPVIAAYDFMKYGVQRSPRDVRNSAADSIVGSDGTSCVGASSVVSVNGTSVVSPAEV